MKSSKIVSADVLGKESPVSKTETNYLPRVVVLLQLERNRPEAGIRIHIRCIANTNCNIQLVYFIDLSVNSV